MMGASASEAAPSARKEQQRKDLRRKNRMRCDLLIGGKTHGATVLDATSRGLTICTGADIVEGSMLRVAIRARSGRPIGVEAMVWHRRRTSVNASSYRLGLVLVNAPDDFPLWMGLAADAPSPPEPASEAAPPPPSPKRASAPPPHAEENSGEEPVFRVRVGQSAGPRTRSLTVAAPSAQSARERALAQLEGDWVILEIRRTGIVTANSTPSDVNDLPALRAARRA